MSESTAFPPVSQHLVREIEVMLVHLSGSGAAVPEGVLATFARIEAGERPPLVELGQAHAALAGAVAPARPRTLVLLAEHRARAPGSGVLRDVYALPLVRKLLIASVVTLVANLVLGAVGADERVARPYLPWAEVPLVHDVLWRMYVVGQAGLGAIFHILWTANGFVTRGTYDPRHECSYVTRLVMGIISGVLLAGIVGEQATGVSVGLLALIGGFSVAVLHRALRRVIGIVEGMLAGGSRPSVTTSPN